MEKCKHGGPHVPVTVKSTGQRYCMKCNKALPQEEKREYRQT